MGAIVFFAVVLAALVVALRVFGGNEPVVARPQGGSVGDSGSDHDWLFPPKDPKDVAGWDRYWSDRVSHNVVGYTDLFVDDKALLDLAFARGFRTVLCAGCGVSQEPRALAHAGLHVTALDVSPRAIDLVQQLVAPPEFLERLIGGLNGRPGGRVEYVVGDLRDPSLCPGSFDIVIERSTVQVFRGADRDNALEALAGRVAPTGLLFTQWHLGGWRPPQPRIHGAEAWLAAHGFEVYRGLPPENSVSLPPKRMAWLFTTSG